MKLDKNKNDIKENINIVSPKKMYDTIVSSINHDNDKNNKNKHIKNASSKQKDNNSEFEENNAEQHYKHHRNENDEHNNKPINNFNNNELFEQKEEKYNENYKFDDYDIYNENINENGIDEYDNENDFEKSGNDFKDNTDKIKIYKKLYISCFFCNSKRHIVNDCPRFVQPKNHDFPAISNVLKKKYKSELHKYKTLSDFMNNFIKKKNSKNYFSDQVNYA